MTLLQDIVWRSCLPWLLCVSFKNKLFFFFWVSLTSFVSSRDGLENMLSCGEEKPPSQYPGEL